MGVLCRFDDVGNGNAFLLTDPVGVLSATTLDEVGSVLAAVDVALASGRCVAGYLSYEAAPAFDPALVVCPPDRSSALPLVWFGIFENRVEVPLIDPPTSALELEWVLETSPARHAAAFAEIQRKIADGWTYQVNLTTEFTAAFDADPIELYRQLVHAQRGAHHGYIATDEFAVACGSPELFFSVGDGTVTTRPMKGTALRGRFAAEDEARAAALVASEKERAENVMIVDLLRNDLGRVAPFGSVETTSLFDLEAYPTLWQLTSTIEAPAAGLSLAALFGALFPCGSVTGAPKASSMAIIAAVEHRPRGVYCGAIGWADGRSGVLEGSFAVPIRSAVVDRVARRVTYGAGGAVVADSTPEGEWRELTAKAHVLTESTARTPLFETLRFEPGEGFIHLERHLRRLAYSAERLGHDFDRSAVERAIAAVTLPDTVARVRIVLGFDGGVEVAISPLEPEALGVVRLGFASVPIDRDDRRLFDKTVDRERYDAYLDGDGLTDDVILWNQEREVTETTRSNLLVAIDGRWWTPPLRCGLLPGIGREILLEAGGVTERVLSIVDVLTAERVEIVSSLRGRRSAVRVDAHGSIVAADARWSVDPPAVGGFS